MGKNKLSKFADMDSFSHVFQYPFAVLKEKGFEMKGRWNELFFKNDNPIVLELGCGKGEYAVGLARFFPDKNFIGIDIKGSRMWTGAKQALEENLTNVAFLRTHIELLHYFFGEGEVSEIWITFPDPQMNKASRRMTSTRFMKDYRKMLKQDGIIHLKTDSNFMYTYTSALIEANELPILFETDDLYNSGLTDDILNIRTYYEQQWLSRGLSIKYIKYGCPEKEEWIEPEIEIEQDSYRSYGRGNARSITQKDKTKSTKSTKSTIMSIKIYPKLILDALRNVRYPGTGKDIVEMGMVSDDIHINGNKVSFSIIFDKPNDPFIKSVVKASETAILTFAHPDIEIKDNIEVVTKQAAAPAEPPKLLSQVKNIIAITSGKGGVGKSTVTANLAVALVKKGYKVGLLDADIFGPSIPKMFGVEDAQPMLELIGEKEMIIPIEKYGIKLLSIGFFVNKESAIVWRGAMAGNALKQLIADANWGDLDYFLIDFPPGTSDIHLTLVQTLAITGAVVVSTPQEVALADARKGIDMFTNDKVNVPILGLVENMAWFTPAELPENKYYIFGKDGAKKLAQEMNITLLGQIPIVQSIREAGDNGSPVALNEDSITGAAFADLADRFVESVNRRNENQDPTQIVEVHIK